MSTKTQRDEWLRLASNYPTLHNDIELLRVAREAVPALLQDVATFQKRIADWHDLLRDSGNASSPGAWIAREIRERFADIVELSEVRR